MEDHPLRLLPIPRELMRSLRKRSRLWMGALVGLTAIHGFSVAPFACWRQQLRSSASRHRRCAHHPEHLDSAPTDEPALSLDDYTLSRRSVLGGLLSTALLPLAADAGKPELDSSGELYTPKAEMLSGGSYAARGLPVQRSARLQPGQTLQSVYETRFIAYLSRFLLNYDPAAHAWWIKKGAGDTWEEISAADQSTVDSIFAEFAESVEFGLADYFVGPYGSYSSLSAATAGLEAARPAPSSQPDRPSQSIVDRIFRGGKPPTTPAKASEMAKQGILNLYTLLKARYTSVSAKRQLAILFSFISNPRLQPTREIAALLGEADNCTLSLIRVVKPTVENEFESRTSSRRGGGYAKDSFPTVTIAPPPALGDPYQSALAVPVMRPTGRVLRIRLLDTGEGYLSAPAVRVVQSGVARVCQATAILDRQGHVESTIVLDPGYGYGGRKEQAPKVEIDPPPGKRDASRRAAKAVADLEYEIIGIDVVRGGNGFAKSEPPFVSISPPAEDPDWFLAVQEQPEMRMVPVTLMDTVKAEVSEMKLPDGNVAFSLDGVPMTPTIVDDRLIDRLQRDPLELLPSAMRPVLVIDRSRQEALYTVPVLDNIPQFVAVLGPQYRAYDPVFGGVGQVPVTKGALELNAGEYARLALSGAVCTVLVRTALNPLELIKTKQQLLNDQELLDYARERRLSGKAGEPPPKLEPENRTMDDGSVAVATEPVAATKTDTKVGTTDLIWSMVELRGPLSLFQSADITFLASLMFGSFGFGATELFRRSFTAAFFGTGEAQGGSEVVLLLAAALATVVTAAAASPFEVLRVRSMGLLESKKWTQVLKEFLVRTRFVLRHVLMDSCSLCLSGGRCRRGCRRR